MDKIIDFLKRSNRYKHLIGGFLVGICALSGQNAIYAARGILRRRLKNAECINRGVRYPGRCPGLWAATGLTARPNSFTCLLRDFCF